VIPGLYDGDLPGVEFAINGQPVDRKAELSDGDEMVVNKIPGAVLQAEECADCKTDTLAGLAKFP
jgi:hypothetical protein